MSHRYWTFALAVLGAIGSLLTAWATIGPLSTAVLAAIFVVGWATYLTFRLQRLRMQDDIFRRREEAYLAAFTEIASAFNFKERSHQYELKMKLDGSATCKREVDLVVTRGEISSRDDRRGYWGNNEPSDYDLSITGSGNGSRVTRRIVHQTPRWIGFLIEFSPPLSTDAQYTIRERIGPGGYAMTKDDILEQIQRGNWLPQGPYEAETFHVKVPTDRLVHRVLLPLSYPTCGSNWDVMIGDSVERFEREYERVAHGHFFKREPVGDYLLLELDVPNPRIGASYWIQWTPPSRAQYQKCLRGISSRRSRQGRSSDNR